MSKRWKYDDPNPAELRELNLVLEPFAEFDAPDDWLPEPNPHPVFKPAEKSGKSAPTAPVEIVDADPATS